MTSPLTTIWLLSIVFIGNVERQHLARTVDVAAKMELGLPATEFSSRLGMPLAQYSAYGGWSFLVIGKRPRQWCYGTRINLGALWVTDHVVMVNVLPFHIRWLGYADDDLVIDLNDDDHVTNVKMPEVRYAIDERFNEILQLCYTVHAIGIAICNAQPQAK
jgi:hypothetical protein